jgi:predicted RND superfamily exporter protein
MSSPRRDITPFVDRINTEILAQPGLVVVIFLILTVFFAGGLGLISLEEETTQSFTTDLPEQEALELINERFSSPFSASSPSTQLIHVGSNVLSKNELIRNLRVIERAEQQTDLRVESASGPAVLIAQHLDPTATTPREQRRATERATQREVQHAVRAVASNPSFSRAVSQDFNQQSASTSVTITVISHNLPPAADSGDIQPIQVRIADIASSESGDIRAFGSGIINDEFGNIIGDSLAIVIPVVLILIFLFLLVAYRDPIDLVLGLFALFMTIIWTFGLVGYLSIPFDQIMIAVPVILLAIGIDFGIHLINRYREERITGTDPIPAMKIANRQLFVAFFIVIMTSVFGFGANLISALPPIQNFGVVASIGSVVIFLIFAIFLPAAKIKTDQYREQFGIPLFSIRPIASEHSRLGNILSLGATVTRYAPIVTVVLIILASGSLAVYGQDVDQTFDTNDFLPPEDIPAYTAYLPESLQPGEYTVTQNLNLLEERFEANQDEQVTLYLEGPFHADYALESIHRTNDNPPDSFISTGGRAEPTSILSVIDSYAEANPEFNQLVERNDRSGSGVPDRNLNKIYSSLFNSPYGDQAEQYLTEDRRALKVVYAIESDASQQEITQDARAFSKNFRFHAVPTGQIVVFQAVSDLIFASAIQSLLLALILTSVFLIVIYWVLERRPSLGIVNMFPIIVSVTVLIATMRFVGIPLNALTATILAITIGLGVDYSVHVTHRFIDEYHTPGVDTYSALVRTLSGTGGALTGSMLTTTMGSFALILAITPVLGDFGFLLAASVLYSYLSSILVLPAACFVWAKFN